MGGALSRPGSRKDDPDENKPQPDAADASLPSSVEQETIDHQQAALAIGDQSDPNRHTTYVTASMKYRIDAGHRVLEHVNELRELGCDTNIVFAGPSGVAMDGLCVEFCELTKGAFRLAKHRDAGRATQETVDGVKTSKIQAIQELGKILSDQGYNTPLGSDSPLAQSRSQLALGFSNSGSRRGSRIGGSPNSTMRGPTLISNTPERAAELLTAMNQTSSSSLPVVAVKTSIDTLTSTIALHINQCGVSLDVEQVRIHKAIEAAEQRNRREPTTRLRVFNGSVLDNVNVPILANKELPLMDKWSVSTLQQSGNNAWRQFTEMCPSSHTLFVYLYFEDKRYNRMYESLKTTRGAYSDERGMADSLESVWKSSKRAQDLIYHSGSPATVVNSYFVLSINCATTAVQHPCVRACIAELILNTLVKLREQEPVVWGPRSTPEARRSFLESPAWKVERCVTVPENIADDDRLVPAGTESVSVKRGRRLSGELNIGGGTAAPKFDITRRGSF
jgi:hypothetical protein